MSAAFNADTDVYYQAYLTAVKAMSGAQKERFDAEYIKLICWSQSLGDDLTANTHEIYDDLIAYAKGLVRSGVADAPSVLTDIPED